MKAEELKRAVASIKIPAGMEERLLAAMQDAAAAPPAKPKKRKPRWLPLGAAAVLALCVGTLLWQQGLLREKPSEAAPQDLMTDTAEDTSEASGDAEESAEDSAAEESMPAPDEGSASKLQNGAAASDITLRADWTAEGALSFSLANGGETPLRYADTWTLEREENGVWRPLKEETGAARGESASAAVLAPGESAQWLGDIAVYGELTAGEYRVVLTLTVEGESRCAAAVFTVE